MNQGYSLAWNGWDPLAAPGGDRLTIKVPVATNPDGSSVTGRSYEYIVFDNATAASYSLAYAADTRSSATLTMRRHLADPRIPIAPGDWKYADDRTIQLLPKGTPFQQSAIYEFVYTAKDPLVAGLGFAATRDFVSFLRHATTGDNPLAGDVQRAYAFTVSQPARYLNDFVALGFNEDDAGRPVFDGIENWIGGGNGVVLNFRFSQPGRTERNRQNHLYPEASFPFAFPEVFDPLTGMTNGRGVRCSLTGTCPKFLQVISANEYWVKAGSLAHTDAEGNDLSDRDGEENESHDDDGEGSDSHRRSDYVRNYLLSGVEHTVAGAAANSRGICQQFQNTTDPNPALRALFVALDRWVTRGARPPRSEVPRVSDGTAGRRAAGRARVAGHSRRHVHGAHHRTTPVRLGPAIRGRHPHHQSARFLGTGLSVVRVRGRRGRQRSGGHPAAAGRRAHRDDDGLGAAGARLRRPGRL